MFLDLGYSQREGFRVIDHRPESLVMIEGSEVQAFFNFLLNCSSCTAMSGTQAGLPPTILSPKPFKGATLKNLKVRRGLHYILLLVSTCSTIFVLFRYLTRVLYEEDIIKLTCLVLIISSEHVYKNMLY